MGCSASKPGDQNNAAAMISICRERKRLIKTVIQRRRSLATSQFKYNQSLHSIATAMRAFVGSSETQLTNGNPNPEKETESDDDDEREICAHFYDDSENKDKKEVIDPLMEYDGNNFGWDFFNLFDGVKTEVANGYYGGGERKVEEERETVADANVSQEDRANEEDEINVYNEVLKKIEESFFKGFECGFQISTMLELDGFHHLDTVDKFQESPMKSPFQSIAWGRSTSSSSSSCKSFFSFSSPCSSKWNEVVNNDCFNENNKGMVSGSHSLTLGRLYAWENKLYQEVKVGEHMKKIYQQKCLQLKKMDAKSKSSTSPEKIKAEVRDLCSRILVTVRRIESISQMIEKLRDEELRPQLVELLNGFMSTGKDMLETHKAQKEAIFEMKKFTHKNLKVSCNESHRLNTFHLETEVQNWSICFSDHLSAQKAYAEALNGWLSKLVPLKASGNFLVSPSTNDSFFITREWLNSLSHLHEKPVMCAMKSLVKDIRTLWLQQGEEQLQNKKVGGLTKELDRNLNALKKEEEKGIDNMSFRVEYLNERKSLIEDLKKKVEIEKEKQNDSTEETQRINLRVFQSGFHCVFDSLVKFSEVSFNMYDDLVAENEKKVSR